ncbi:MAG: hypothetical protein U9N32_03300 [Spirochaetota bacterium]|nr:hypothetical protein [Spirochaetota bacterium]
MIYNLELADKARITTVNSRIISFALPGIFSPENDMNNQEISQYFCA